MDVLAVAEQSALVGDSTPGSTTFCAGGVGRNIAEALVRLSVPTQLFSIVGDDSSGRWLLAHCRQSGIDCSQVQVVAGHSSSYVAVLDDNGALLHAINAMSIIEQFDIEDLASLNKSLGHASVCVVDANLSDTFIDRLCEVDCSCELAADAVSVAKCRRLSPLLSRLRLLKVNREEAIAITGSDRKASNINLLNMLLDTGCRQVLMTLGESGSIMATKQTTVQMDAAAVETIQTVNGAGDSLFAGVIAGLLHTQCMHEQLRWGVTAAALSLQTTQACSPRLSLKMLQAGSMENE